MEDEKIIDLYWERKDEAIMETQAAYGRQLQTIAQRIVQSYEDAEESVNDTYLAAWRTIPPKRPKYFFAYLAKICRNFAFGKLDWLDAARRKAEVVTLSEEMELFVRRYWYVDTVAEIAQRYNMSESKVKTRLHRIREKLRVYLMQEGIAV